MNVQRKARKATTGTRSNSCWTLLNGITRPAGVLSPILSDVADETHTLG